MNYTRIKVFTNEDMLGPISAFLIDKGIEGVEIQEPKTYREFLNKKNVYDWDYVDSSVIKLSEISTCLIFYMEDNIQSIDLLEEVLDEIRIFDVNRIEIAGVDDENWKYKWKEYFKATPITDRIVVKPSWESYEAEGQEIVIEIDPEMAFGTGTHPTTTLCIELLEKYVDSDESIVLDIGCGSGILSIGAALLGAKEVLGIEIDPDAVMVAQKNIKVNGMEEKIQVRQGDLTHGLDYKANVVVANLMADLIIILSKDVSKHLLANGIFIASGILIEKKDEVIVALKTQGFSILDSLSDGEWCAVVGGRA